VNDKPLIPPSPSEDDYVRQVSEAQPLELLSETDPVALFDQWLAEALAREPNDADFVTAQPHVPPAHDRLSRKSVRALVERAFKGKLADRELTPRDYDRLTAAVMRLQSASRSLRRGDESRVSPAVLDRRRRAVRSALDDIETITGVPPSQLGDVLASDED